MSSERWNDGDLRAFVVRAPRLFWGDDTLADADRRAFRTQFMTIAAPGIQSRVLAKVGARTSPEGLAALACEMLEDCVDHKKRDWLLVCAEPWGYLEQWVAGSVVKTHRATAGRASKDAKVLEGIATVSSREALESGEGE